MNLFKEIIRHEVYPAMGCTEPIACAYAAAVAAEKLGEPVDRVILRVDRGTYKNGAAVTVPHSGGQKCMKKTTRIIMVGHRKENIRWKWFVFAVLKVTSRRRIGNG